MLRKTCPWLSLPTSTLSVSRQTEVFLLVFLVFLYGFFLAHYTQCPSDSSLCLLERQRISSSKLSRIWRDTWRSWRTSGNSRATFISRSSDVLVLPLLKQWKGQLGRCWVQTESLSCQSEKIWSHLSHGGELYQVDWVGKYHLLWRDHSLTGILDCINKEVCWTLELPFLCFWVMGIM